MRWVAPIAAATVFVAFAGPASADERSDRARLSYESALAHYHLDEFDDAIRDFQAAYRARPDPTYLYDVAQAARRARRSELALEYYEKYLRLADHPSNLVEVTERIAALRRLVQEEIALAGAVPLVALAPAGGAALPSSTGGASPTPASIEASASMRAAPPSGAAATSPPAPNSTADPALTADPSSPPGPRDPFAPSVESRAPRESQPIYKRWWLWAAIGGGAAIAIVGISVGVAVGGGTDLPRTDYGPIVLGP